MAPFRQVWLLAGAAAAAATLMLAQAAQAKPKAPVPIAPASGTLVEALPAFAWKPVRGTDHYEFQIAADSGFNSPVLGRGQDQFSSRNTRATLKKTVPNGKYWWRVRSVGKNGDVSRWSNGRFIEKSWTASATTQTPANAATVTHPAVPLALTWSPVPGAAKYRLSLATDPRLGSLVGGKPIDTQATSYTPDVALAPGTYYWVVTPLDAQGNRGEPSKVASFVWAWPSTTATRVTDLVAALEVFDPQFAWDPVAGAARYEVEVNSSQDFAAGSKVCCSEATIATSLSPTVLFRDNTYYWRVRALDADGNAGVWNLGSAFTKAFDKVPPVVGLSIKNLRMRDHLSDPGTDAAMTAGYQTQVPIVVWDPVPGASSYEVEVTGGGESWLAKTAATAWTPLGANWNNLRPYPDVKSVAWDGGKALVQNATYSVRVRARSDRDPQGNEVYGDFTYLNDGTGSSFTFVGYPTGAACSPSCNLGYLGSGDYVLPAAGTTTGGTPLLTWRPILGAQSYFVIVAKDPSFSNIVDYAFTQIPAYAPRPQSPSATTTYPDETTSYYWVVLPSSSLDGGGAVGNPLLGASQSFQKRSAPPALLSPAAGAIVTGQPTFQWTPAEGARRYHLQVSQDPSFGNPIDDVTTNSTAYSTSTTYPADTILYWRVRADDENLVGLTWSQTGTFQRQLPVPAASETNVASGDFVPTWTWAPIPGAVSYDLVADLPDGNSREFRGLRSTAFTAGLMTGTGVFRWQVRANFPSSTSATVPGPYATPATFTRTIREPTGARTSISKDHVLLSWEPKLGAKFYRLEISTRPDFAVPIETVNTDNTSYAPLLAHRAYLDGGKLYWRVSAVDEERNEGDFSPTQRFALARGLRLSASGFPRVDQTVSVTITARDAAQKPVRGVTVKITGAGVAPRKVRTGPNGTATLSVRATRPGTITYRATKTGFRLGVLNVEVR